ncbi:alcohol dehydrogenase [Penicillium herquei]|nr:alcohol dehydrogenase [Penicillium herquei]
MGHEFGGTIEEVGADVEGLSPGQRVVVRPTIFDKTCLSGYGGGMAHYLVAPSEHFYPLPDNISFENAALIEPLAVAWHAVNLSPFLFNDSVVILGGGPIGVAFVQILKLRGAMNIIVVELMEKRKELARSFGATSILDPSRGDIPIEVRKITKDKGADVIFDTAGVEVALNGVIPACKVHGTIVNIAVWEDRPALEVNDLMYHEVNYVGAALYDEDAFSSVIQALEVGKKLSSCTIPQFKIFRELTCMLGGQLYPEKMISAKIDLAHAVDQGFQELIDNRDQHCKILIDVQT